MTDTEMLDTLRDIMLTYAGSRDEFNGWVNRETWAAALHLSNDEYLYNEMLELCEEGNRFVCGEKIQHWVEFQVNMILYPDSHDHMVAPALIRSMISDVGSFWRVEWPDVADGFMPEDYS